MGFLDKIEGRVEVEYKVFLTIYFHSYMFQIPESGGCAKKSGLAFFFTALYVPHVPPFFLLYPLYFIKIGASEKASLP